MNRGNGCVRIVVTRLRVDSLVTFVPIADLPTGNVPSADFLLQLKRHRTFALNVARSVASQMPLATFQSVVGRGILTLGYKCNESA